MPKSFQGGLGKDFEDSIAKSVEDRVSKKFQEGLDKASQKEYEVEIDNVKVKVPGNQVAKQFSDELGKQLSHTEVKTEVDIKPEVNIDKGAQQQAEQKMKAFIKGAVPDKVEANISVERQNYDRAIKLLKEVIELQERIKKADYTVLPHDNQSAAYIYGGDVNKRGKVTKTSVKSKLDNYLTVEDDYNLKTLAAYVNGLGDMEAAEKIFGKKHADVFQKVKVYIDDAKDSLDAYETADIKMKAAVSNLQNAGANFKTYGDLWGFEDAVEKGGVESALKYLKEKLGFEIPDATQKATEAAKENAEAMTQTAEAADKQAKAENNAQQESQETSTAKEHEARSHQQNEEAIRKETDAMKDLISTNHSYVETSSGEIIDTNHSFVERTRVGQKVKQTRIRETDNEGNPTFDEDGNPLYSISYQQMSNYTEIVNKAAKATVDLQKAQNLLKAEQAKGSKASNENIKEYGNLVQEASDRLAEARDAAQKFNNEREEFINDPDYDSKYLMQVFDADVAREATRGIAQANIAYNKAIDATSAKAQKAVDSLNKKLNDSIIKVDNIQATYDKSVAPGVSKPVTQQADLMELSNKRTAIMNEILRLQTNGSATNQELLDLEKLIAEYKLLAKVKKDANNPTKREMGGQELVVAVEQEIARYDKLIAKSEQYGSATDQITASLKAQRDVLKQGRTVDDYYDSQSVRKQQNALLDQEIVKIDQRNHLIQSGKQMVAEYIEEQRQAVADTYKAEDLEYLDKRNQYLEQGNKLAAEQAQQAAKRTAEYEKIFFDDSGNLNETIDTQALAASNALYDRMASNLKEIYDLKEANLKVDNTTLVGQDEIAKNEARIAALGEETVAIRRELSEAEAIQVSRENELLGLHQKRNEVLREMQNRQELQSRDDMTSQVGKWITQVESLQASGKYAQEFREQLDEAYSSLISFSSAEGSIEDVNAAFVELDKTMKKINSDKGLSEFKKAQETSIAKLNLQIEEFARKNSKMGADFQKRFANLKLDWDTEHTLEEVQQLVVEFNKLKQEVTAAGKTGASFFETLRQRAMGVNAQLIAQYLSWQDLIRYTRQALEVIKELDYELIDLKKTTAMSNSDLKEFYYTSNNIARQMGVTTAEIINQASSWSRLGYNSKEAVTEMAQLSSQFASISPGMGVEEAQTGLVSIMKAWDVDVSRVERDIMDNINTLGNKFAETNADIIGGMERAGATLSAIGMDIEDSFALFTGAQEVIQNAETVGVCLVA